MGEEIAWDPKLITKCNLEYVTCTRRTRIFFSIIICHYDMAVHINSKMLMRDVTPYYQYIY